MLQNQARQLHGQAHKNWYIFGDYVRLVGNPTLTSAAYGMFTQKQLDEANQVLQKFNEAQQGQVIFYAYLTGFKVPLAGVTVNDFAQYQGDYKAFYRALNNKNKEVTLDGRNPQIRVFIAQSHL